MAPLALLLLLSHFGIRWWWCMCDWCNTWTLAPLWEWWWMSTTTSNVSTTTTTRVVCGWAHSYYHKLRSIATAVHMHKDQEGGNDGKVRSRYVTNIATDTCGRVGCTSHYHNAPTGSLVLYTLQASILGDSEYCTTSSISYKVHVQEVDKDQFLGTAHNSQPIKNYSTPAVPRTRY